MRRGDIEGTYAELDLGRMLYSYKIDFQYIKRRGVKGKDYDVEITFPDGTITCTEAKCKIESTDLRADTICTSLNRACSQLPDDRPGIAFVKVPRAGCNIPTLRLYSVRSPESFWKTTPRSFRLNTTNGTMRHQHAYEEIANPINDFDKLRDWRLFYPVNVPDWRGMPPIGKEYFSILMEKCDDRRIGMVQM
jgi:hypothetical protein